MKTMADGKSTRESWGFFPIDGKPIKPLVGMIYWYGWGDDEDFDIRIVRRILGLAEEQKIDEWFMAKNPNHGKAYMENCRQINTAMKECGRSFADIMEEHDRLLEEASSKPLAFDQEVFDKAWPKPAAPISLNKSPAKSAWDFDGFPF